MATQRNTDNYLVNQFILFYTLKHLWKLNEHPVSELYKVLFPSKNKIGGNKTLYDNILRGQVQYETMVAHSTRLEELTGISKHYFTGQYELSVPNLIIEDWHKSFMLRGKSETEKPNELKELEAKIKREIRNAKNNQSNASEPLRRLMYFAEYKHKRADKTLPYFAFNLSKQIFECLVCSLMLILCKIHQSP